MADIHQQSPTNMVLTRRDKTTPTANQDIELRGLSHSNDPFSLTSFLKSDAEITAAKANTSRPRTGLKTWFPKKNSKKVSKFYESQNDIIRSFLKTVDEHEQEAQDTHGNTNRRYKIAVWGSLIANFILAGLQLYGAISSGSLSLYTTMIDSIFDPVSGVLLLLSHRAVKRVNLHKYPSGRARVSTAGNIVFSFLMFSVSLVLIVMSIRDLASGHGDTGKETKKFNYPSIIAVGIAFVTKLALFFYCWSLKGIYSQVEILWKDHRNDSIINAFGILTSVGGSKLRWFIDPMGALILSLLISFLWLKTAFEEFQLLIGVSADADMQRLITYVAMTHSPLIQQIDTVRAYHSGPRVLVEVDVVIDRNERLEIAHDVAEALQIKLKKLPNVERAFVHIDYETDHKPEHDLKKVL